MLISLRSLNVYQRVTALTTLKLLQLLKRSATLALRWKTCAWTVDAQRQRCNTSERLEQKHQKRHMFDALFLMFLADNSRIIDCFSQ